MRLAPLVLFHRFAVFDVEDELVAVVLHEAAHGETCIALPPPLCLESRGNVDGIVYLILPVFPNQFKTGYAVCLAEIGRHCVSLHGKLRRVPRKTAIAGFRPKAAVASGNHCGTFFI